jgi:hypothetical protein
MKWLVESFCFSPKDDTLKKYLLTKEHLNSVTIDSGPSEKVSVQHEEGTIAKSALSKLILFFKNYCISSIVEQFKRAFGDDFQG